MSWWARLFGRDRVERRLDAELQFHFDQMVDRNRRAGMSEEEARRSARLEFGGLDVVKEECRDSSRMRMLEQTMQDLRYAARMLSCVAYQRNRNTDGVGRASPDCHPHDDGRNVPHCCSRSVGRFAGNGGNNSTHQQPSVRPQADRSADARGRRLHTRRCHRRCCLYSSPPRQQNRSACCATARVTWSTARTRVEPHGVAPEPCRCEECNHRDHNGGDDVRWGNQAE